jgi:predicted amidophosphoribosyltransferase
MTKRRKYNRCAMCGQFIKTSTKFCQVCKEGIAMFAAADYHDLWDAGERNTEGSE